MKRRDTVLNSAPPHGIVAKNAAWDLVYESTVSPDHYARSTVRGSYVVYSTSSLLSLKV